MLARSAALTLLSVCAASAQSLGFWDARSPLPIAATEVSAAAIGDKVYVVCGITPDGLRSNRLFVYDSAQDSWTEGAPLPIALGADHCNFASAGGKLYFLGGIRLGRGFLTNQTFRYDPELDQWSELERMPTVRGASGVAAVDGKIYVAGGEGAQDVGRAFEVFDTQTERWAILPDLPTPRTHLTAQAAGGKIYAIGGRAGRIETVTNVVEEYDPETRTWTRRAAMPTARGGAASGVIGGRIIVFGGEGPSRRPEGTYEQVEEYDPASDAWRTLSPMPFPRHGFQGASVAGNRIHVPGGGPQGGATFSQRHDLFLLNLGSPPLAPPGGLVSAASYSPALAAGSIAALFGASLASMEASASSLPLPTRLAAAELRLNGAPVPLFFVSPEQINFQIPFTASGVLALTAFHAGDESAAVAIELQPAAPAIFTLTKDGSGQAAALLAGTGLIAGSFPGIAARRARRGEAIEVFCTGLGAVDHPPAAGEAAPSDPLARTLMRPRVTIGGAEARVLFAGLAPGLVAVYQVNASVPDAAPSGENVALTIEIAGVESPAVTIGIE